MKIEERKKAVKLRKQGLSYNEISKLLQVSKSSLSHWLRGICEVPEEKFRIHLRIHNDLNKNEIKSFWSKTTGISLKQFHKTTWKKSISNGNRHNKLPYGIAAITVCDTNLFYKIQGWIEALIKELKLK